MRAYLNLLEDHALYRVILVTGPQRTGTTFVGRTLAADTGRTYVDETDFGVHDYDRWQEAVSGASNSVIQCPTMMKYVHDAPDDALVVVMQRAITDILKSQERINWNVHQHLELARYGLDEGVSSEVKYAYWNAHKTIGPRSWIELEYESMSGHPRWVPTEQRTTFTERQTET